MNNGKRSLSVGILIDERPLSRFQILVFALCGLIMLLDGFDALCMRFLAPAIVDDLGRHPAANVRTGVCRKSDRSDGCGHGRFPSQARQSANLLSKASII